MEMNGQHRATLGTLPDARIVPGGVLVLVAHEGSIGLTVIFTVINSQINSTSLMIFNHEFMLNL